MKDGGGLAGGWRVELWKRGAGFARSPFPLLFVLVIGWRLRRHQRAPQRIQYL